MSNVPAVMLLLSLADGPQAGVILALASTRVGSIANLIVADQAARLGVRVGRRAHTRAGIPITVWTCLLAAIWLWWRTGPLP